jgi:putative phosphoesterase
MQSMRIGLIADTHGFLDEALFEYFSQCDEVWHAGDFGSVEVLERLRQFKPVRGVYGNIDGPELRSQLAEDLRWTCEGLRVYMTHVGGYPGRYDPRAKKIVLETKPGLFVCGHSHILKVMRDLNLNLIHMNPGACGNAGWHQVRTGLRFTVAAGKVDGVEEIELGRRGL